MRNTGSTALLPDWYVDFQASLLQQAPRPGENHGEIDQVTAEGWTNNQKSLKKKLTECLLPPFAETIGLFLTDTFRRWYNKTDAEKAHQSVKIVSPKDIDRMSLKDDIDKGKFGEYTMNPDTVGIDWENIPPEKIKVFDFAEFVGRPRWELAKHIAENYSDKYHIPGIEYWKYLIENEDKIPKELKDGNYYYFFGSILRDQNGHWNVPSSGWDGSQWDRYAIWLKNDWYSDDRVLLLEK